MTLSRPPTNHFAKGSRHCSTRFHGLNQISSFFACFAQNFSGARIDSLYNLRYCVSDLMRAFSVKSLGGLNTRCSLRTEVMAVGLMLSLINDRSLPAILWAAVLPSTSKPEWLGAARLNAFTVAGSCWFDSARHATGRGNPIRPDRNNLAYWRCPNCETAAFCRS